MKPTNSENTLKWRVAQLEANYDKLDGKIDKIRTNELPHIHSAVSSLKTRINILTLANISAIIIAAVLLKILGL